MTSTKTVGANISKVRLPAIEFWLLLIPLIVCIGAELVLSGTTFYNLVVGIVLILLFCSRLILRGNWAVCLVLLALYTLLVYLVNFFEPFSRFDLSGSTMFDSYPIALLVLIAPVPVSRTIRVFRAGTIRHQLLVASMLLVLLPTSIVGAVSILGSLYHGRQQLINQLESVATLKEAEIETWISHLESDMAKMIGMNEVKGRTIELLSKNADAPARQLAYRTVLSHLVQSLEQTDLYEEFFLIDISGRTVVSTQPGREGQYHSVQPYFRGALQGFYVHPPVYSPALGLVSVMAALPVVDAQGETVGVLASRVSPVVLNAIMLERTGLGKTGETYLVDRHHTVLTGSRLPLQEFTDAYFVFTVGANSAVDTHEGGSGTYENYRGERVIGVYRWLPRLQVALLAEQHESEAFDPMYGMLRVSLGVAIAAVLGAAMFSILLTERIASRLSNLAETATRIASGDLEHTAEIGHSDEIGILAQAFNSMTRQLRELISNLEQRVQRRTLVLQRRALQLETNARVSREITSILDIDQLLTQVVRTIQDAFGYYHVQILLADEERERLVLQAASGEVGQRLKDEGYSLLIGPDSLNGQAAFTNSPIISNDVSKEPHFHADNCLAGTRSEMVIPLRIGQRVIGTLDVQSSDLDGFSPEDIVVIQSLGDQVSIALENARLYQRSRDLAVLEERNRIARELHDSVTQSLFSIDLHARAIATYLRQNPVKAQEQIHQLRQITKESLQEMRSLIFALRPYSMIEPGLGPALQQLVERERRSKGPRITLQVTGNGQLPTETEIGLFRVAQEAIRNAIKHAYAHSIHITLTNETNRVRLAVVDDGQGFDLNNLPSNRQAFGLVGMKERVQLLGGILLITSTPSEGTCVGVDLPIPEKEGERVDAAHSSVDRG